MDLKGEYPDIKCAGLRIWVHGRESPDSSDYWDANWLNVSVNCRAKGSEVRCIGSIIHLSEILHLQSSTKELYRSLEGKAELPCMEPELYVELLGKKNGQIEMKVNITPDNINQQHIYVFDIDQSHLLDLIKSCDDILETYPIIGHP